MMTLHLPWDLAEAFHADHRLSLPAQNAVDLLQILASAYPGMQAWLTDSDGRLRPHLSVFISGRRLTPDEFQAASLPEASEVWIMRAISGG